MTYGIVIGLLVLALLAVVIAVVVQTNEPESAIDDELHEDRSDKSGPLEPTYTPPQIDDAQPTLVGPDLVNSFAVPEGNDSNVARSWNAEVEEKTPIHEERGPDISDEVDRDPGTVRI